MINTCEVNLVGENNNFIFKVKPELVPDLTFCILKKRTRLSVKLFLCQYNYQEITHSADRVVLKNQETVHFAMPVVAAIVAAKTI